MKGTRMGTAKVSEPDDRQVSCNISYYQVFRYATCLETVATVIGAISGLLSGAGVCYNLVQFGELSTAFVERTSNPEKLSSHLPLTSLFGGGRRLQNATHEQNMAALVEDAEAMAIGLFISIGISTLLCATSVTLINWSALRQITRIRMLFLVAVLRQDMSWYDTNSEFNLASKMSENLVKLKDGMGEKLSVVCNLLGTAIICLCCAFPLGWELTLACIVVVPFSIAISVALTNYETRSSIQEMEQYSKAGKQAEEVLKSIKTVVAFGGEQKEIDRYKMLLDPAERFGRQRGLYSGVGNGFNWVLTFVLNAVGFAYGTRLVLMDSDKPFEDRKYIVGVIFSILFNVYMGSQSITMCVPHLEAFATAKGAAASIFQLIDRKSSIDSLKEGGLTPRRVIGEISLEDIHFSYPARPDIKVLKGFSLTIKRGECVALVGSSGCGKSTVLQLMQRLYDPLTGAVKLDGRDLKNLNLPWLRSCLGVVGQEPVLFRGTIHENIAIGAPHAAREDVQRVAEVAYAHDFIKNLSKGYDTMIGERGASLSGGQKQRIAIARSLLRDPAVLLLDEATSALDPHSERQVQIALDRASIGRTTITVSHRLSTIINANRIICMDQGAIVEQGTHDDLIKLKGFYYNLVKTSSGGTEPTIIEPVLEETEVIQEMEGDCSMARVDVKRKSSRRLVRHPSKNEIRDWIVPRSSISSIVSAGLPSYINYGESQTEDEVDDSEIKSITDWQIIKLNAPEWLYMIIGAVAAMVQGACFPAFAVIFGYSSGIFVESDHERVIYQADLYSGLLAVVAFIAGISMCIQGTTFTSSGLKMTTRLRHQYFSALLRQEIGFYDRASNAVGAICARLSGDAAEIQSATGLRIGIILQGISSLAIGVILAFTYNWKLTLVAVAFLPLMIGSIWFEGKMSRKSEQDERLAMENATTIATEAVVSIKTVQSLGVESTFLKKFEDALSEACAAVTKQQRWRGLVYGLGVYVPFAAFVSAAVYGAILVSRDEIKYKIVLLVVEAIMYGAYMLGHALVYAPSMGAAKVAAARILSLMQRVPTVRTEDGVIEKNNWVATGCFSVKAAEFSYPTRPHQRVLKGLDLSVEAGKTVALVGSSGCGKSTVLQLMQRFYDPESGNIELDGSDIRSSLTLPRLRRQLGVVQQEPVLFDRTIGENIAYGDNTRKVSTQEIVAAAKAANIHNFIVSMPMGYDTNLGAGGGQLSGGQKQRVCIARALIRSPRLLLLDEATSALDANSERAVSEALEKAAKGRTCITIAHRLTTIQDADLICVVDKGQIVEKGTHAELINLNGHYSRMCKGQSMG